MEQLSLSTIKGYGSIVAELNPILAVLKDPSAFENLGVKPPKGLLLYGIPGTGKTTMAKAFISDSGRPCFSPVQKGTTKELLDEVRHAFEQASDAAPSIVFLDDMDKYITNAQVDSHALHVVQALIDSVAEKDVFVIATANDIDDMPESLLRKGRFDHRYEIEFDSPEEARELLDLFLADKKTDGINPDDVAAMCRFMSVATIKSFVNEAALKAAYEGCQAITIKHIVAAAAHRRSVWSEQWSAMEPNNEICIHEIGHVIMAEACQEGSVGFVFTDPNDGSGFTRLRTSLKRRPHSILMSLAGKVAAEHRLGRLASGCYGDLGHAFEDLDDGIRLNGLLGLSHFRQPKDIAQPFVASELERYLAKAREVIVANEDFLSAATELLGKQGYLLLSDIHALKAEHPIQNGMLQGI